VTVCRRPVASHVPRGAGNRRLLWVVTHRIPRQSPPFDPLIMGRGGSLPTEDSATEACRVSTSAAAWSSTGGSAVGWVSPMPPRSRSSPFVATLWACSSCPSRTSTAAGKNCRRSRPWDQTCGTPLRRRSSAGSRSQLLGSPFAPEPRFRVAWLCRATGGGVVVPSSSALFPPSPPSREEAHMP
jgi:hypothetical protein